MGLIMVIGIVAKNGILLLDADERARAEGRERARRDAARGAAAAAADRDDGHWRRCAACCRLAFALGAGSQMLQPLAIAVIGGLLISVVLSLMVTPAIYYQLTERSVHVATEEPRA